jgi:Flp pilus assembly pilin Flp
MRLYARRPVVGDRRGAGLVEYLMLVGLIALVALAGFTAYGRHSETKTQAQAACVRNLSCTEGQPGAAAVPGVGEAASTQTATPGDGSDGAGGDDGGKGLFGTLWDVGKGFVLQGWDTVKGLAHIVMHPIETAKGLWFAVTHPVQTYHALKDAVVQAWNENPEEFVGRAIFEIVTIPLSVGKLSKLKAVNATKNAANVASAADKVGDAAKVADKVSDAAKVAMRLDDGIPGSAVAKLKNEILSDPKRAAEIEKALANIADEAIAGGPEAQLLRREMLSMSLAEREALMAAVKSDLGTYSGKVSDFIAANPDTKFKRVIIGGGPQGQNIANELHRLGDGTSTLVIDAVKGDQNFGSIRKFDLNSSRGHNPLYGSPVQAEDFSPATKPFPSAGDLGDASTIGLYSAMRRGTDVLTDTKVTNIVDGTGKNWPGRYRIDMVDANGKPMSVYTDQTVVTTGLGKPVLPRDPASRAFDESEIAKLADNPEALKDVRVISGEDLLRHSNHVTDEAAFYTNADAPTYFIGAGDAAKTAVEHYGSVTANATTRPQAVWVGVKPDDLTPKRYIKAKELVESGTVQTSSGRLSKIEPIEGSRNVRLTFETPDGPVTKEAGKVVMAIGMQSDVPKIMKGVVDDFDPKVNLEPVTGVDPKYADPTLAKRVPGQDVYVAGIASGMERPNGVSFLEYFGHKNSKLAEQVLVKSPPTPSPIQGTRTPPFVPPKP